MSTSPLDLAKVSLNKRHFYMKISARGPPPLQAYLELLEDVIENGAPKGDRTGTGTRSLFGRQLRFDLGEGFPAVTTKKLHFKSIIHELLWFLRGETNVKSLQEVGVTIWDDWADKDGELGPIYGHQWRSWAGADGQSIDQIEDVVEQIRRNPNSRRLIVSAWNVPEISKMALPPCHTMFQFYVAQGRLSCQLYQRSADIFLGVPFNIASYAILVSMIAQVTGLVPGDFVHSFGDVHLYENHLEQATKQLTRAPYPAPTLWLNSEIQRLEDFNYDDIRVEEYKSHPSIKAPIAV